MKVSTQMVSLSLLSKSLNLNTMKEIKNIQELINTIEQPKPVLLDFYADWCGPCRTQLPVVEKLAERYAEDFVIQKVNVDKAPDVAGEFNVRSIPALFFIKDKQIVEGLVGYQSESVLDSKIQGHLA